MESSKESMFIRSNRCKTSSRIVMQNMFNSENEMKDMITKLFTRFNSTLFKYKP